MEDLAQAIRYIRDHADEFNVSAEEYAIMGFSAGGHLTASFGTESLGYAHYNLPAPAALILSYPVITMGEHTHNGSRELLLGKNANNTMAQNKYSVESQVTENYPASYLWQFDADNTVPIENTRVMVEALDSKKVKYKYRTFPGTIHGAGLGADTPAEGWLDEALDFFTEQLA